MRWSRSFGQAVKPGLPDEKDGPDDGQAEAVWGELTAAQLAAKHGVHQTMVGEWKEQAVEGLASVFSGEEAAQDTVRSSEAEVERDVLAKASGR